MSLDPNRSWVRGYSVLGVPVIGSNCTEWESSSDLVLSRDRLLGILQKEVDFGRSKAVMNAILSIDHVDQAIIDMMLSNLDI